MLVEGHLTLTHDAPVRPDARRPSGAAERAQYVSLASAALRRPVTTVAATLAVVLLGAVSLGRLPGVAAARRLPAGAHHPHRLPRRRRQRSLPPRRRADRGGRRGDAGAGRAALGEPERRSGTTLRFAWGTDMTKTVLQVRERLDNARAQLPDRAERPTLLTSDPGERPIAVLALTGPGDLRSIARTAEDVHARRLEQLAGVASVAVVGEPNDEIRVEVDPEHARALGLTPGRHRHRRQRGQRRRARRHGSPGAVPLLGPRPHRVPSVERDPRHAGRPGAERDPAARTSPRSRLASADPTTLTRLDGAPAVGLVVYKDAGANTVAVTGTIYSTIDVLPKEFPDVQIKVVAAQAQFVTDALSNLWQEIIAGGVLSLLVILLFLRDWRISLAIGLMVPLSVLVALTMLQSPERDHQHPLARRPGAGRRPAGGQRHRGGRGHGPVRGEGPRTWRRRPRPPRRWRAADRRHAHDAAGVRADRVRAGPGGGAVPRPVAQRRGDADRLAGAGADADAGDDGALARQAFEDASEGRRDHADPGGASLAEWYEEGVKWSLRARAPSRWSRWRSPSSRSS